MKKNLLSVVLSLISFGQLFAQSCIDCDANLPINQNLRLCIPVNNSVNDESSFNNTVNLSGTQLATDRKASNNSAISFDGLNDYITIPNPFDFPNRTYAVWFNATTIGSRDDIMVSDNPSLSNDYTLISLQFKQGSNKLVFYTGTVTYEETISLNTWYHAAISVNGNQVSFYINGVKKFSSVKGPLKSVNGTQNLVLGAARDMTTYYFHGLMDEVRVYSRALSDAEIDDITNDTCNGTLNREQLTKGEIKIYPNPASGNVKIESKEENNLKQIQIFSVTGSLVYENLNPEIIENIDIKSLKSGIYFVKIIDGNGNLISEKLLVY